MWHIKSCLNWRTGSHLPNICTEPFGTPGTYQNALPPRMEEAVDIIRDRKMWPRHWIKNTQASPLTSLTYLYTFIRRIWNITAGYLGHIVQKFKAAKIRPFGYVPPLRVAATAALPAPTSSTSILPVLVRVLSPKSLKDVASCLKATDPYRQRGRLSAGSRGLNGEDRRSPTSTGLAAQMVGIKCFESVFQGLA